METVRSVVIGCNEKTLYLIDRLQETAACELVGIITNSSIAGDDLPDRLNSNHLQTDSLNNKECKEFLRELDPELGVCLGWYSVIGDEVLGIPTHGILGIHAAPLPDGRGQAPINWQMILDYQEATATVFQFTSEVDAGPIYGQRSVPILNGETVDSLYDRITYFGIKCLCGVIRDINSGKHESIKQTETDATYWPERRPEDSLIDWNWSASQIERFCLALSNPYPNPHTFFQSNKIKITEAVPADKDLKSNGSPGEVVIVSKPSELGVQTGSGVLLIKRIKTPNQIQLTGSEFATEYGITTGDKLGKPSDFPSQFRYTTIRGPDESQLIPETNISVGETVRNRVYYAVSDEAVDLSIQVIVDGELIIQTDQTVYGQGFIPFEFELTESGTHFVRVQFEQSKDRTYNMYVHG